MESVDGHQPCPAIKSVRLKPFKQRINRIVMSIVDNGKVSVEILGKAQTGKQKEVEVTKELIYISSDGMKIQVYQNSEGVHSSGGVPGSGVYKEFVYPNLSQRLWKKYMHAYKFVEVVKSKTPKIILLTDKVKCKLMENSPHPDFEATFQNGLKVLMSKGKVQISEGGSSVLVLHGDSAGNEVSEKFRTSMEYAKQCQDECFHIQDSISQMQRNNGSQIVFPITVGTNSRPFQVPSQSAESIHQMNNQELHGAFYTFCPNKEIWSEEILPVQAIQRQCGNGMEGHNIYSNWISSDQVFDSPFSPNNANCFNRSQAINDGPQLEEAQMDEQLISHVPYCSNDLSHLHQSVTNKFQHGAVSPPVSYFSSRYQINHLSKSINDQEFETSSPSLQQHSPFCAQSRLYSKLCLHSCPNARNKDMIVEARNASFEQRDHVSNQSSSISSPDGLATSIPYDSKCCPSSGISAQKFLTPKKSQLINRAALNQYYTEGCVRVKSCTSQESCSSNVVRNLFSGKVLEEPIMAISSPHPHQQHWPEVKFTPGLDLSDCHDIEDHSVRPRGLSISDNIATDAGNDVSVPLQNGQLAQLNPWQEGKKQGHSISRVNGMKETSHTIEEYPLTSSRQVPNLQSDEQHLLISSSEHDQIIHKTDVPFTVDQIHVPNFENQNPHTFISTNAIQPYCQSLQNYPSSHEPSINPLQHSPSRKVSRKIAPSLDLTSSKQELNVDSVAFENYTETFRLDMKVPDSDEVHISLSQHSACSNNISSTNSHIQSNSSSHSNLSSRKIKGFRVKQDQLSQTLPQQPSSPSHNKTLPTFPVYPQKEFIQGGGRDCQLMDLSLPTHVRNSLDISHSSCYSDSPSSTPSSSCDPIYQVFVPYTGWASYYAGGAIWVLYNDGTQLGVKATEATMTFIDQDGSQTKYINSDVVPEIVKMKLEKLPSILKAVMNNKNATL